jgi:Lrp/AsnC family leucine-responsive transcriptional regulator
MELDNIDLKILKIIQEDAKFPLEKMTDILKIPKSTIAYRVKKMEKSGIIRGYHASIDPSSINLDYVIISLIKTKYGKDYHNILGKKLSELKGVWGVYFVLGDNDFIAMARYKNREDFMKNYLERLMDMPEIERTNTQVVAKIIKETPYMVIENK